MRPNSAANHTADVRTNGISLRVTVTGEGPPVLLLHGWPFTSHLWRNVTPALAAAGYRVIAPDLRGIGGSDKPPAGYDLHTVADDMAGLLKTLDAENAFAVGFDLGTPIAWMLAMREPARVRKLVVMEAMVGRLPGAEAFVANGPPWWFGFHGVPGLAEAAVAGNEGPYLDWFWNSKEPGRFTLDPEARKVYLQSYGSPDGMRGGLEHYRAMPVSSQQVAEMAGTRRLTQAALAIAGGVVGEALYRQLAPISDHLVAAAIGDCGHNIPEEKPQALVELLLPFFAGV